MRHPLAAALLVVPALELAGVVPLMPANVGIAGGAAAVAFHAGGMPMHAACVVVTDRLSSGYETAK